MVRCALLLVVLSSSQLTAETWTDATGRYQVEADFVSISDGVVSLKRIDGSVIQVPLAKLDNASRRQAEALEEQRFAAAERSMPATKPSSAPPTPQQIAKSVEPATPATPAYVVAKTPNDLVTNLVTAFRNLDKEAFLASFYTPDDLTKRLANDEADKAIAFSKLRSAFRKIDERLGEEVFDQEKFKDRPTWVKWNESEGLVTRTWIALLQPEHIKVELEGDSGKVTGTYRKSTKNMRMVARGDFKIAQVDGKWYVDERPSKQSVLKRMPKNKRDQWLQSFRDKIDTAMRVIDAFEREAGNMTDPSHVAPAIKRAVEAG